ncbi:MAG TPA: ABC transporter permease [Thermoanaerobaculia bacterium]|nr:ABC transporter permease [Thermoanaerobaculia bacterium]
MSSAAHSVTASRATALGSPALGRIYWLEAKTEALKQLRLPAYVIPTLIFPVLFYLLFGVMLAKKGVGSFPLGTYLLATYGAFGVIGAAFFGFGVGIAVERGQGWLLLKRASPMPVGAYFAAKIALALLFSAIIVGLLFTLGATVGGAHLSPARWLGLGATLLMGALPFCAFGLVLGSLAGPNSAPAIVNVIYLPMAFLSGLWVPIQALPKALQQLAPALPPYHFAQLALKWLGADQGTPVAQHLGYLVVFTALCLVVAAVAFRRDKGETWG